MHYLISGTLALGCSVASLAAIAVPFQLPDDGWYQLQRTDNYVEVCNSSQTTPCDVEPGTYQLINQSLPFTDPLPPTPSVFALETQIVTEVCSKDEREIAFNDGFGPCIAMCPDSYTLTGGFCKAGIPNEDFFNDEFDGVGPVLYVTLPVDETPGASTYQCDLIEDAAPIVNRIEFLNTNNFTRTEVEVTAICSTIVSR